MTLTMTWIMGGFQSADWIGEGDANGARYAYSLSSAGDVNGDGFSDVIVGAPDYEDVTGSAGRGRSFVYHGSAAGLDTAFAWTAESDQDSDFGSSVAGGGDVNGDGFDDVLVGDWTFYNGETDEGAAFVYHGSAAGLDTAPAWTAESDQTWASFGVSVSFAGDVNGDGYHDVVVGAPYFDNGENGGSAFVYHGSATGLDTAPAWTAETDQSSAALFGVSVSNAGDVNGDGFGDVIVGAPWYDNTIGQGRVYVHLGSAAGLEALPAWTTESNQTASTQIVLSPLFGRAVASAGDVDGDGYDDVLVGAPYFDNGETDEGQVSLFFGSASGPDTVPAWTVESNLPNAVMGWGLSGAGDVNADGYGDVIVGVLNWDAGTPEEGAAFVYLGTAAGPETISTYLVDSDQAESDFGVAVASAGDVDGDGYDDVLVGAQFFDNGHFNEGRAFLYSGGCADPVDSDGDQVGDLCDVCPGFDDRTDSDIDGVADGCDVCPALYDPMQADDDSDGIGDACDPCPMSSPDSDGDGFCTAQECDDDNPTVYPGAEELCDGLDNACAGTIDPIEIDEDGDGEPICAGDCDDANPELFSGQAELCNGLDDNCDGEVDQTCDADEETEGTGCACNGGGAAAGGPLLALALLLLRRRR